MIEPLNPHCDNLLDFKFRLLDDSSDMWRQIEYLDENDTVALEWGNVTIRARAGTVRAWVELATVVS